MAKQTMSVHVTKQVLAAANKSKRTNINKLYKFYNETETRRNTK